SAFRSREYKNNGSYTAFKSVQDTGSSSICRILTRPRFAELAVAIRREPLLGTACCSMGPAAWSLNCAERTEGERPTPARTNVRRVMSGVLHIHGSEADTTSRQSTNTMLWGTGKATQPHCPVQEHRSEREVALSDNGGPLRSTCRNRRLRT